MTYASTDSMMTGPKLRPDSSMKSIDVTIETSWRKKREDCERLDEPPIVSRRRTAERFPFDPASLRTLKGFPRKLFHRERRADSIDFHRV